MTRQLGIGVMALVSALAGSDGRPSALRYRREFAAALRPDPLLTVSQWADAKRRLSSRASAEPGEWRTDRTPYLREIMDALSPSSPALIVDFIKGAQIGGTECGNNWIGYIIDQAPGPMLAVQPTVEMAKRNSKQRIDLLISESPCLSAKVKEPRKRDSGNTVLAKEFPGGLLVMTGANSAVGLRSMSARYLFLDEIDAYPPDVDGEGDPITLAMARQRTFPRRKTFRVSTPKLKGESRIEEGFEAGSQERYHVPCPLCQFYQVLDFSQMVWPAGEPGKAQYRCEGCKELIPEYHKTAMLEKGRWVAANPNEGKHRSFHLSSLYSPVGWFSWADAAAMSERAKEDPALQKVFVNTVLGETWNEKGEAPDDEKLYLRCEDYAPGTVPAGGLFLTAGIDVQADRIEVQVVAWGRRKESWLVDYSVLVGRTSESKVWQDLSQYLDESYEHESGLDMSIVRAAIDSGYATQDVYGWARSQAPGRVLVIKGGPENGMAIGQPKPVDVNFRGKRIARGMKVRPVATGMLKAELYTWLRGEPLETVEPTDQLALFERNRFPAGYCHFPKRDREFFKQLTAEHQVGRLVKGYTKREWVKTRERNEVLDTRIYARAAAAEFGMDRWNADRWAELERQAVGPAQTTRPPETSPAHPAVMAQTAEQPRRSNWLGGRGGASWLSR